MSRNVFAGHAASVVSTLLDSWQPVPKPESTAGGAAFSLGISRCVVIRPMPRLGLGRPTARKGMGSCLRSPPVAIASYVRGSLLLPKGVCPIGGCVSIPFDLGRSPEPAYPFPRPLHVSRNIPQHLCLHVRPTPRRQRRPGPATRHNPGLVHEESQEEAIGQGTSLPSLSLPLLLLSPRSPQACDACHKSKRRCDGTGMPCFSMSKCTIDELPETSSMQQLVTTHLPGRRFVRADKYLVGFLVFSRPRIVHIPIRLADLFPHPRVLNLCPTATGTTHEL